MAFASCACSLNLEFDVDPIRVKELNKNEFYRPSYDCLRYTLPPELIVLEIDAGEYISNQFLNLIITDQDGDIIREKQDIKDSSFKIVFKPFHEVVADICISNLRKDASWWKKENGAVRRIKLNLDILDSKPKYDFTRVKATKKIIESTQSILDHTVSVQLDQIAKKLKYLIKREYQLRNLNESVYSKLLVLGLLIANFVIFSQVLSYFKIRKYSETW